MGPFPVHLPDPFTLAAPECLVKGILHSKPGAEHEARLGPCELPRNRSQVPYADVGGLRRTPHGAAADIHLRELCLRRCRVEIFQEAWMFEHDGVIART